MLLPASVKCSGSNYSSFLSNNRVSTRKCLLRFSEQFLDPTDKISEWHEDQHSRVFRTIQYRKERAGVGHEFILLLLQRDPHGDVDCCCRVERVGDPKHIAEVIFVDGTIPEDYIQAIPLSNPDSTSLTKDSDVVAEITFPHTFMLRDVLAICYGISNHYRAKRYTLQQYNCYFFSWTLILALARACMNWDVSPLIPEHVSTIHDRIMQSIYDQGPARFRSAIYIVSNNTLANHENEEHPLDQAVRSRLHSPGFADSITGVLQRVFWADRLHLRLIETITEVLIELAKESVDLTTYDKAQSGAIDGPITQEKRDLDFEYEIGRLTQQAALVVFEDVSRSLPQILAHFSPTCNLLKRRLGHEVWCKELASSLRHPGSLYREDSGDEEMFACKSAKPDGHQPTNSSIRDLCFIPPSVILGFSARFVVTCGMTFLMCFGRSRVALSLKDLGAPKKNVFQRVGLGGKTIVQSAALGIRVIPRNYATSKHLVHYLIGAQAARRLDSAAYGLLECLEHKLDAALMRGLTQALELFDTGLRELMKDKEYQLNLLRPCVIFGINAVLNRMCHSLRANWGDILRHFFLDTMAGVTERELEGYIGLANGEKVFRVRKSDDGLSQVGTFDPDSHGGLAQTIKTPDLFSSREAPVTSRDSDLWSHQDLQHHIRQRISQLSKRETSFAPYLKCIPFLKTPEVCQKEIEVTMEEIWVASSPLMKTRPYTV